MVCPGKSSAVAAAAGGDVSQQKREKPPSFLTQCEVVSQFVSSASAEGISRRKEEDGEGAEVVVWISRPGMKWQLKKQRKNG
jgi:hypothetical protein